MRRRREALHFDAHIGCVQEKVRPHCATCVCRAGASRAGTSTYMMLPLLIEAQLWVLVHRLHTPERITVPKALNGCRVVYGAIPVISCPSDRLYVNPQAAGVCDVHSLVYVVQILAYTCLAVPDIRNDSALCSSYEHFSTALKSSIHPNTALQSASEQGVFISLSKN